MTLTLHWSPRSPFVRKVMVAAHERGVADRLTLVRSVAITTDPNPALMAANPLNKIPTLERDDGPPLTDSRVICEFLDTIGDAPPLIPEGEARWPALRRQAMADGLTDLLVLWRGERGRPQPSRPHLDAYRVKAIATLDRLELEAVEFPARPDIGDIAVGCALAYADFRFADLAWRGGRPRLASWQAGFDARPAAQATAIVDDEAKPMAPA
ncbi:glutathione S-transferase family protein [Sphingomonas gilva]|uniref:Glutathione S-transferase family protein n=1 Tax=Sphingomonas gilva TaxID=2305907 RepID=A0A396RRI0_9SPHN|nr:glutathione S-transferase family protein [Sphingomonas gilva]RHW19244.1 glutathione S-transferase family protein [Sphingomonas gilva]